MSVNLKNTYAVMLVSEEPVAVDNGNRLSLWFRVTICLFCHSTQRALSPPGRPTHTDTLSHTHTHTHLEVTTLK